MPAKHNSAAGISISSFVGMDERLQFDAAGFPVKPHNRQRESQPAGQVHHQCQQRISLGLLRLRVTDQQERTQRGDFPKEEQPHEVVGENQAEHRAHENKEQREEKRPAVRDVTMRHFVVFPHVTQRIKADAATDQAVDQGHDDGELVHEQILRHLQMCAGGEFKPDHQSCLSQHQQYNQRLFCAQADVKNEQAHRDFDERTCLSGSNGCSGKIQSD